MHPYQGYRQPRWIEQIDLPRLPMATPAAHGARPMAHGRHVCLVLRRRTVRGSQRRPIRSWLLRRTYLWAAGGKLRSDHVGAREQHALRPSGRVTRQARSAAGDPARNRPCRRCRGDARRDRGRGHSTVARSAPGIAGGGEHIRPRCRRSGGGWPRLAATGPVSARACATRYG